MRAYPGNCHDQVKAKRNKTKARGVGIAQLPPGDTAELLGSSDVRADRRNRFGSLQSKGAEAPAGGGLGINVDDDSEVSGMRRAKIVGRCLTMCPPKEMAMREEMKELFVFEVEEHTRAHPTSTERNLWTSS